MVKPDELIKGKQMGPWSCVCVCVCVCSCLCVPAYVFAVFGCKPHQGHKAMPQLLR